MPLVIAVGPEGGVTAMERRSCLEAGSELISLGPSTLRFETAALAAVALVAAAMEAGRNVK